MLQVMSTGAKSTGTSTIVDYLIMAKYAKEFERFEDMVTSMIKVAEADNSLTKEGRDLLAVAYAGVVQPRLGACSSLHASRPEHADTTAEYMKTISEEISYYCKSAARTTENLMAMSSTRSERVFYQSMYAEYTGYSVHCPEDEDHMQKAKEEAIAAFRRAFDQAEGSLSSTDSIRLGVAQKYSEFMYDVVGDTNGAIAIAKLAFEDAIADFDALDEEEEDYEASTSIMRQLRDHLTLWVHTMHDDQP